MSFDFASAKQAARQAVHRTLGVDALYQDSSVSAPVPIRVRWHSKIDRFGDQPTAGYAEVVEGIHRVILEAAQARAVPVKQTGIITMPATMGGARLSLETREPADGPFEECWTVVKV